MKKILQIFITIFLLSNVLSVSADVGSVRQMEYLTRGTVAVSVSDGVYISWRLLGTESLENQTFDIYRNDILIHTTDISSPTCYTDTTGTATDVYKVVKSGESAENEKAAKVWTNNITGAYEDVINSTAYLKFDIDKPLDDVVDMDSSEYSYDAGDASVGDVDGDGEYEVILKWDPSNQQDNGSHGYTGNVYVDAYKTEEQNYGV